MPRSADQGNWRQKLIDAGASSILAEQIAPFARPSVKIVVGAIQETDNQPIGASKFNGMPDLPTGMRWPRREAYKSADREMISQPALLNFICQIRLSDIAAAGGTNLDLPESGLLSLFYDVSSQPWGFDPADRVGFQVHWFQEDNLVRAEQPIDAPEGLTFPSSIVSLKPTECLPPPESQTLLEAFTDKPDLMQAWEEFCGYPFDRTAAAKRFLAPDHVVGGWPVPFQNPMEVECQFVSNGIFMGGSNRAPADVINKLRPGWKDWHLLLQLSSDDDSGWMWGDMGSLYVWIRKQDLAARDFSNCWVILQCG